MSQSAEADYTSKEAIEKYSIPRLRGTKYYSVLEGFHNMLKPDSYLEIGIRKGDSLALARCASIGIDPRFELAVDAEGDKPALHLFNTTSDKFFEETDPCELLGKQQIDMFFLDGAHYADFLLRDFLNAERFAAKDSMIVMHDCIPLDIPMTMSPQERKTTPYPVVYPGLGWGDCWRVIKMLQKHRPDVKMYSLDSAPTGLVLLTNLDKTSDVLSTNYDDIVKEMNALDLAEIGIRNYVDSLNALPTSEFTDAENLAKYFKPWDGPASGEQYKRAVA